MTTPKSAEEIIRDFTVNEAGYCYHGDNWLHAALASHTAYLLGKMPKTEDLCGDPYEEGYDDGIADGRAILEAEITELTK